MANPRQRRKVRSASHKPVRQSRRANKNLKKQPPIKGPKVLQDAWDKRKTVRQNYMALGLAHSLTPTDSGGKDISHMLSQKYDNVASNLSSSNSNQVVSEANAESGKISQGATTAESSSNGKLPRGFGRIIRDESGAIVEVILAEDEESGGDEAEKDMELDPLEIDNLLRQPGRQESGNASDWLLGNNEKDGSSIGVVKALEVVSASGTKIVRTTSAGETRYLASLVEAHGQDFEKMSRDRRRNVQQYTAGQLKRAIAKAGL